MLSGYAYDKVAAWSSGSYAILMVAAESGSISAAAERLHVAQPAVSRQIHNLELEIGVPLLERQARGVQLTPAGAAVVKTARQTFIELDLATEHAKILHHGGAGELKIAFNETYSVSEFITDALHAFRNDHPQISLSVASMNTRAQIVGLRSGELDVGFFFDRNHRDAGLSGDPVMVDKVVVAVPRNSPFAEATDLQLTDLATSEFIGFPRKRDPWFYDQLIATCRSAGFSPRFGQLAMNDSSMMSLVAAGLGVAFLPRLAATRAPSRVTVVEPSGLNIDLHLELVHRTDHVSSAASAFREVVRGMAKKRFSGQSK